MTNLNNTIEENQYKQQSGIKQSDDENKIEDSDKPKRNRAPPKPKKQILILLLKI